MNSVWALLISALFVPGCVASEQPGVKVRLTAKGLDLAKKLAMDLLLNGARQLQIPTISQSQGPIKVTISRTRISSFPRPESTLKPVVGNHMRWRATKINPIFKAQYRTSMFGVSRDGSVTGHGIDMSFRLDFNLGRNTQTGEATVSVLRCAAYGNIKLVFRGEFDGPLNYAATVFEKSVSALIRAQLCVLATEEVESFAADVLKKVPTIMPIFGGRLFADRGLVEFPSYNIHDSLYYIEFKERGVTSLSPNRTVSHATPPPMPQVPAAQTAQRMIYLFLTDFTVNSFLQAVYDLGVMRHNATTDQMPQEALEFLRTTCPMAMCFGTLFAQIGLHFPNRQLEFFVQAAEAPTVTFKRENQILTRSNISIDMYAKNANNDSDYVMTIDLVANTEGYFRASDGHIYFNLTDVKTDIGVPRTAVPIPNAAQFVTMVVNFAVNNQLKGKLNAKGMAGIKLSDSIPDQPGASPKGFDTLTIQHDHVVVCGMDVDLDVNALNKPQA